VKVGSPYQIEQMGDYYILDNKGQSSKVINNNSTVESLRKREKANNEYFFRQAQQKNQLGDNSTTR
jgi:hypothetical protein